MFQALFAPIQLGSMTLKNRFVMPPMGSGMSAGDGTPSAQMIAYHEARAKGGFALNILEVTLVKEVPGAVSGAALRLTDDSKIPGFRALADAVHAAGGKLAVQLYHHGRQGSAFDAAGNPVPVPAPSPLPCPLGKAPVTALTTEQTYEMIDCFVQAAVRAKAAGADAVEVHGAHGYLVAEYLSAYANRRTDEFGGSFENRMRFARLILEGIRQACGPDYPILFRFGGDEKIFGGRTIEESRAVARYLEPYGVSAFHVTSGVYGSMTEIWGGYDYPMAYMSNYAAEIKRTVQVPVITAGRINDPFIAEELISGGTADMVSLGRQSIADPEFPNKVLTGRLEEICPCIGCHQGCTGNVFAGKHISCTCNPFVGKEAEWKFEQVETPKKILIAGAGPAGQQAAWILAKRGHKVTVLEKQQEPGGNFRIAALPPGKADLAKAIRYQRYMGEKYGVTYRHGMIASETELAGYDTILLATGTQPLVPDLPGIDGENVWIAQDVISGQVSLPQGKILVAGGGMVGCETAEFLKSYGCDVTIVEMAPVIAADVAFIMRLSLLPRLKREEIQVHTGCRITSILPDGAKVCCGDEEMQLHGYDGVVLALGGRPQTELLKAAEQTGAQVYVIGDAAKPGNATAAIYAATELALKL